MGTLQCTAAYQPGTSHTPSLLWALFSAQLLISQVLHTLPHYCGHSSLHSCLSARYFTHSLTTVGTLHCTAAYQPGTSHTPSLLWALFSAQLLISQVLHTLPHCCGHSSVHSCLSARYFTHSLTTVGTLHCIAAYQPGTSHTPSLLWALFTAQLLISQVLHTLPHYCGHSSLHSCLSARYFTHSLTTVGTLHCTAAYQPGTSHTPSLLWALFTAQLLISQVLHTLPHYCGHSSVHSCLSARYFTHSLTTVGTLQCTAAYQPGLHLFSH